MPNEIGVVRRSALISPHGPGAIVDFRAGRGPVSGIVAGLDEWDRSSPAGLMHPQVTYEPRLQAMLGVEGFRLPPVSASETPSSSEQLVAARFPTWLVCPTCNRLRRASRWGADPGSAARYCGECSAEGGTRAKTFAVPSRFVIACTSGHLDEFPWHWWVAHKAGCTNGDGDLILKSDAAGLAGMVVSCPKCEARKTMDGIFGSGALEGLHCLGRRPWLASANESCGKAVRVLQRGASNLYFAVQRSALDIPPWSDQLQAAIGQYWEPLRSADSAGRKILIQALWPILGSLDFTQEELAAAIDSRVAVMSSQLGESLRDEEYRQFISVTLTQQQEAREFECRPYMPPPRLLPWIARMVEVVRLREVRALLGFTRISPPGTVESGAEIPVASIQVKRRNWLPAIEVRGEGIFLALDPERIREWEERTDVVARAAGVRLEEGWAGVEPRITRENAARALLVHTLSHLVMKQLALDCGYSAASLRERLYISAAGQVSAGFLIYTSSPDADGTLGGLCRQGQPQRLGILLERALTASKWCSSDPLCMSGVLSTGSSASLAACHCCSLAPETSCELFNRLLDRAMLVGTPENPQLGFFSDLIKG